MAKTLYLHVGMPKCASTTIQGALRAHAEVFAENGKFYGFAPRDTTEGQGNVTRLLADIRNGRTRDVRNTLTFFFERDSDIILSSESFIGLARNQIADDLIARAAEAGFETRIICYLRRQDEWIESDYKQHIKGGSDWCDGIEALIARRTETHVLNYHWMLGNWARIVGHANITVVPLNSGQDELYPLERFLAFLGMDPGLAEGLAVDRQNVSPAVGLVEPMRYLKAALMAQGMKPADIPRELHRFAKQAPGCLEVPQRRFLLPLARRRALLQKYAASNTLLSQEYLGGASVFDAEVREETGKHPALAVEAAAVLAAWIVAGKPWRPEPPGARAPDHREGVPAASGRRLRWWPLRQR